MPAAHMSLTYCGWKKSCTTLHGWNPLKKWDKPPINWCRISSIHGGISQIAKPRDYQTQESQCPKECLQRMKDRCHLRARLWICGFRMLEAVPVISALFRSSLCFRFHHEEGQNYNQKMFTCTCWYLLFLLQPWYMFWFRLTFTPGLARMCIYI